MAPKDDLKAFLEDIRKPVRNQIFSVSEKGKTYRLLNKISEAVLETNVDGALFSSSEDVRRCDYAFTSKDFRTAILVELKGNDVKKAIEQIATTLEFFKGHFGYSRFYGRIVASKYQAPKIIGPRQAQLSRDLKASGGTLEIKNRILEESLKAGFML